MKEEVAPALMRTEAAPAGAGLLKIEIRKKTKVPQDKREKALAFKETPHEAVFVTFSTTRNEQCGRIEFEKGLRRTWLGRSGLPGFGP